jgi:Phage integrase, N-terminal SAM-like domain
LTAFASRYLTEYARPHKKPRAIAEDERLLKLHILPALGSTKIREIGKADVARFHAAMQATPVAANRALALLSAMLGWAEKVGERPDNSNPCRHIERYPEKPVERLLTVAELARLGQALDRAAQPWKDASRAAWREECERRVEAMETPLGERAGWIKARMPRRVTAEDWRAIAAFRLLTQPGSAANGRDPYISARTRSGCRVPRRDDPAEVVLSASQLSLPHPQPGSAGHPLLPFPGLPRCLSSSQFLQQPHRYRR